MDVAALLDDSATRDAQSARDSENLAMLVDRLNFGLNLDYVEAVTDPEDPQVKRDRLERKKRGIKPPPLPLLAPIAQRDPVITAELVARYRDANKPYEVSEPEPGPQRSKLARVLDLFEGRG